MEDNVGIEYHSTLNDFTFAKDASLIKREFPCGGQVIGFYNISEIQE